MKIVVSGGTGLVGRAIVETLAASGHEVVVAGRTPPRRGLFIRPAAFLPLSLDPLGPEEDAAIFAGMDAFVHAAFDHVPGRYRGGEGCDPARFVRVNRDGSLRLLAAARRAGVRRAVFLSSRAVYDGLGEGVALVETSACAPDSLYGQVKLETEQGLDALCGDGFVGVSVRATGVYGALRPNKWDGLIEDYLAGRPVTPRAGSELHGADLGRAVRLLLETPVQALGGRVFNVSDIVTDHREILDQVRKVTGSPHPLPVPADRSAVRIMATERIRALGWRGGGPALFTQTVQALARLY
jgi:UDP-glucose 4-epimerase